MVRRELATPIQFSLDIDPILEANCSVCHSGLFTYQNVTNNYIDAGDPSNSLILLKPSGGVGHGGGTFESWKVGTQNYRFLLDWISEGAEP